MEIRGAKEAELEELVDLQCLVFRKDGRARYRAYVQEDPSYRLDQSRLVFDRGRIVAHLRVWDRQIRVRGAVLRAGGIGSVLVHPDFRGQGYAQTLMNDTDRYFFQAGYDLGLLFTIIGPAFYARLGWTPLPLPAFSLRVPEALPAEPGPSLRRLSAGRDLEAVSEIHRRSSEGMTGVEVRSAAYWTSGPSRYRKVFPEWGAGDRLAAYVNFEAQEDRVWVKEAGCLPGREDAFGDLALRVLAEAAERGVPSVAGSLPEGHPLVGRMGGTATWGSHDKMMVKLVNWGTLAKKLGGTGTPESPGEEGLFWEALLGLRPVRPEAPWAAWMRELRPAGRLFYWWSDIF